jgi:hypothetical protein
MAPYVPAQTVIPTNMREYEQKWQLVAEPLFHETPNIHPSKAAAFRSASVSAG